MAKKNQTDIPEILPMSGGSFLRNNDGSLTQIEGPGIGQQSEPAAPADQSNQTKQE